MERRSRWPRWVRWSALSIAAVVIFGVVIRACTRSQLEEYEDLLAELRAQGYALRRTELAGPEPAASENGAPLLDAAVAKITDIAGDPAAWKEPELRRMEADPYAEDAAHAAGVDDARAFLDCVAPAIAEIDAASRRQVVRWPVTDAPVAPMPWVRTLRLVQQVLRLRQRVARSPEERVEAARVTLSLGRRIHAASLITALIADSWRGGAVDVLRRQVERGDVSAAMARRALDPELRTGTPLSIDRAARFEIAQWAPVFLEVYRGGDVDFGGGFTTTAAGVDRAIRNPFLRWWIGSPCDVLRDLRAVSQVSAKTHAESYRETCRLRDRARPIARTFQLEFPIVARKGAQIAARLRLARISLAATELRETTGAWPASLDDLRRAFPDGVPTDPFTDAPFAYEVRGRALRIASAGCLDDRPAVGAARLVEEGLAWTIER